jgi:DNA-binding NarL/FixJ family response regulator
LSEIISDMSGVSLLGEAGSVGEAIQGIRKLQPNVVVLDIRMPGGSGIDVLGEVKKYDRPPVVIMITNYQDPMYRDRCMQAGADFFFDKSTEFGKVQETLASLVPDFSIDAHKGI